MEECPVARALAIVGDRWTLLVLRDVHLGIHRFDALQANLGISRKVLAQRLAALVDDGVLERVAYQERPRRFEYHLTEKGTELGHVLLALKDWGERWAPAHGRVVARATTALS